MSRLLVSRGGARNLYKLEVVTKTESIMECHPLKIDRYYPNTKLEAPTYLPWEIMDPILETVITFYLKNCQFKKAIELITVNKCMLIKYYSRIYAPSRIHRVMTIASRVIFTIKFINDVVYNMSQNIADEIDDDADEVVALSLEYEIECVRSLSKILKPYHVGIKDFYFIESPIINDVDYVIYNTTDTIDGLAYVELQNPYYVNNTITHYGETQIYRPVIVFDLGHLENKIFCVERKSWQYVEDILHMIYKTKNKHFKPLIVYTDKVFNDLDELVTLDKVCEISVPEGIFY